MHYVYREPPLALITQSQAQRKPLQSLEKYIEFSLSQLHNLLLTPQQHDGHTHRNNCYGSYC